MAVVSYSSSLHDPTSAENGDPNPQRGNRKVYLLLYTH
jgi:hypothetical protein